MVDVAVAAARAVTAHLSLFNRAFAEWLIVAVLCAGLAGVSTAQGWLWRIDGALYDAALSLRRHPPDPDVVIVAIDDRSLAEIGRWPWSRAVHAALLEHLTAAGARVVALDLILHEAARDNPLGDQVLAAAIAAHGRVVLPVTHAEYAGRIDGEALPAPVFAAAAAALAHIHIELDPDGIARSLYLWEGMNHARYPQLSLAALALGAPTKAERYPPPDDAPEPGWRRADWLHIPFIGPPGTYRHVSYVDVLRGEVPAEVFRDAFVFVGASAFGMGDSLPTPTSGHASLMPGVEIHATVFSALRSGNAVTSVQAQTGGAIATMLVFGLAIILLRSSPRTALMATFGFIVLALGGATVLLVGASQWFAPAGLVFACALAYPLWSWRRLESAQHYLDAELIALRDIGQHFAMVLPASTVDAPVDRFGAGISVVRDAARRQRDLQRFVTGTLDRLPVGAIVLDPQGEVRLCNRRAFELLGVEDLWAVRATLAAMPWPGPFPESETVPGGADDTVQIEVELSLARVVIVSATVLRDEQGRSMGTVIGVSDITELREAQRSREDTLHFLSHDMRAPLASIVTLAELAQQAEDPGEQDRDVLASRVERCARAALGLAENMIRLVKAEVIDPERFAALQLGMLAHDAADESWALAQAKGVRLVLETGSADEDIVRGDADLLRRAIGNLLINAIEHTPASGAVRLRVVAVERGLEVQVEDSGTGIPPDRQARLFERFSRFDAAEEQGPGRTGGIGLGLLMVKTVAERHGGSVSVVSEVGKGSLFRLYLPASHHD